MGEVTGDTEAIRAALDLLEEAAGGWMTDNKYERGVAPGRAALGRLVARLEADEQALEMIAAAENRNRTFDPWARDVARAALAAAAPGETTEPE